MLLLLQQNSFRLPYSSYFAFLIIRLRLVVGELVEVYADEKEGYALGYSKGVVEGVISTNFCEAN